MKKLIHNIYAFFYLCINWNPWLAIFITWHELKRGPKYGIDTVMPERLEILTIPEGDIKKSLPYEAVSYYLLEKLLSQFRKLSDASSITDIGCGKGRVMVVAAHFGFRVIRGIDFAKELCEEAAANMERIQTKFPGLSWKVTFGDVLNYELTTDDSVFFMFNPFNKEVLEKFLQKVERSIAATPRQIWFIYASPLYLDSLLQYGYHVIWRINPKRKLEAVIVTKKLADIYINIS